MNTTKLANGLSAAGIGVGLLGALSPKTFAKVYGIDQDDREVAYLTVLFSTRNIALSSLAFVIKDPAARRAVATTNAVLQFTDMASGMKARHAGLRGRSTIGGPLTSAAFGAVAAYVAATS